MQTRMILKKTLNFVLTAAVMFPMIAFTPLQPAQAASGQKGISQAAGTQNLDAPLDTPDVLVPSGVTLFTIASPKVFWYTGVPPCPPSSPQAAAPGSSSASSADSPSAFPETFQRIATYGGLTRTLYYRDANCGSQDVASNIVSDGAYIYWMSRGYSGAGAGLVRLSVNANPGDLPQTVTNQLTGSASLGLWGGTLYVATDPYPSNGSLNSVDLASGAVTPLVNDAGPSPSDVQIDGMYVYWLSNGTLYGWHTYYHSVDTFDSGVYGYHAQPPGYDVIYGKGNQVIDYSNYNNDYTPLYTSADASAQVFNLESDSSFMYILERRPIPCSPQPCFVTYNYVLLRAGTDGSNPQEIYAYSASFDGDHELKADGNFLYWYHENGSILRLPKNAAALPKINMRAVGLEVNQGIQDLYNDVRLIQDRRTFVRMYVSSDGPGDVPGVTAYLYLTDSGGSVIAGPLTPVNPIGSHIRVKVWADRTNINDSFLFELPWSWVDGSRPLYLQGVVNPNRVPLQTDYSHNTVTVGPLTFQPSPRLEVQFVAFGYTLGNTTYYPRFIQDIIQTYSWIRRAYPVASTPGFYGDVTPGFRPNLWFVYDDGLGSRVSQTAPECASSGNLCASAYTNNLLNALRAENGVPNSMFMYGMISDMGGFFPRGQAGGGNVSSGPTGSGTFGWDTDGSYADWYAAHEIGHTLGRAHPSTSAVACGNSASDDNYPYSNGDISNGLAEGFDGGDPGLNPALTMRVYPGIFWHDVMSYCNNQWISDYTYDGMYDYMIAHPPSSPSTDGFSPSLTGDFLSIFGSLFPTSNTASIDSLSHLTNVAEIPSLVPGDYSIRLLDGGGNVLHDYAFTPADDQESGGTILTIAQVVNFVTGTTRVEIVRNADQSILASRTISANAPQVSNVQIGATSPVTGTVTLSWTASDADHDPLHFDIYYSRDGGSTFLPFMIGVTGTSLPIDTSLLAGSDTAVLRVTANDGANLGSADSPVFAVQYKPPQPIILTPAGGVHVHYGQLINFSGMAYDLQDGSVSNLVWSDQNGQLGTGELVSSDSLPVGANTITLTAQNTHGSSASASITVYVDDDLSRPSQVSWHLADSSADTQTAQVVIGNGGSGSLDWTASENAPWLSIDALSGTAPYTLTLTVDPSGLPAGFNGLTDLNLISPAASDHTTETLTIPVDLSIGNVWQTYGGVVMHSVFLPLVTRVDK
jgi:hypothetical protein